MARIDVCVRRKEWLRPIQAILRIAWGDPFGITRIDVFRCARMSQADRVIRTGQLHALLRFHIRPINVVVCHDSRRDLVSRGASRLDAFSGYPVRT